MTRLLPATLALALLAAPAALAQTHEAAVDYTLTMPALEKCNAAMVDVLKKSATDPKLQAEQNQEDDAPDGTLEETAAYMEKKAPVFSGMLRKNGCPPLEFLKVTMAWAEASMAQVAATSGGDTSKLSPVTQKNLEFVRKNEARLNALQAELAAAEEAASKASQ